MQHGVAVAVETVDVPRAQVCEANLLAGERQNDLPRVEMPGEHEVERVVRQPLRNAREVAQEDPEIRLRPHERLRRGISGRVGSGIDAHNLHALASQLDLGCLVRKQGHTGNRVQVLLVDLLGEGIAARGEVVVPEDDERGRQLGEMLEESRKSRPARDEIAGDEDEVRFPPSDPFDGLAYGPLAARGHTEVEIRQMSDPHSVESCRDPR